ncbi:hypothetical protein PMIN06_012082 [Paraphaeosphaeria minitans]
MEEDTLPMALRAARVPASGAAVMGEVEVEEDVAVEMAAEAAAEEAAERRHAYDARITQHDLGVVDTHTIMRRCGFALPMRFLHGLEGLGLVPMIWISIPE